MVSIQKVFEDVRAKEDSIKKNAELEKEKEIAEANERNLSVMWSLESVIIPFFNDIALFGVKNAYEVESNISLSFVSLTIKDSSTNERKEINFTMSVQKQYFWIEVNYLGVKQDTQNMPLKLNSNDFKDYYEEHIREGLLGKKYTKPCNI